jgi:hypothetical protein
MKYIILQREMLDGGHSFVPHQPFIIKKTIFYYKWLTREG